MVISLRAARINKGLTQYEVAKLTGVSISTISNYETGKTIPKWDVLQNLSDIYGVDICSLARPVELAKPIDIVAKRSNEVNV